MAFLVVFYKRSKQKQSNLLELSDTKNKLSYEMEINTFRRLSINVLNFLVWAHFDNIKSIPLTQSFFSLKELRNCIPRIIRVWSLFCSIRVYRGLHFLPIFLENQFFLSFWAFCVFWLFCVEFDVSFINFLTLHNHCL